jgi:hypothetical protein
MKGVALHKRGCAKRFMSDNCDIKRLNTERLTESVTSSG